MMAEKKSVEKIFSEIGQKIDTLLEKTQGLTKEAREELGGRVEAFHREKKRLERELHKITNETSSRSGESWTHVRRAFDEMIKAVQTLVRRSPS